MLRAENLKKYFGAVRAVDGCSFTAEKDTITSLIGPNGSGKTTVFNIISGIMKADFGQIFLNRTDITNKKPEFIANFGGLGTSRLFQQPMLFENMTVRENILLALDNNDTKFWRNLIGINNVSNKKEGRVDEMLALVDMEDFRNFPARELSYGQKRLVELVRAISKPHMMLMLDEPVAGVNPKLRKDIAKVLLNLKNQGETTLLIEHDMSFTLRISDKIVVMNEGKTIAEESPGNIRKNPRVIEAYMGK